MWRRPHVIERNGVYLEENRERGKSLGFNWTKVDDAIIEAIRPKRFKAKPAWFRVRDVRRLVAKIAIPSTADASMRHLYKLGILELGTVQKRVKEEDAVRLTER